MKAWVRKAGRKWKMDTGRSLPRVRLLYRTYDEAAAKERELREERKLYGSSGIFSRELRGDIDNALGQLERIAVPAKLSECVRFWILHNRPHAKRIGLRQLLDDLFADRSQTVLDLSPIYLHSIKTTLEPFVAAHEAEDLSLVTSETIRAAIRDYKKKDGTKVAPVTQANLHRYLHMLFEFATARGNIPSNPVAAVENIWAKARRARPQILTLPQAEELLTQAHVDWQKRGNADIYVYVILGLFCGIRREELLKLSVHNLHSGYRIEVAETESKNRGFRTVPLPTIGRILLEDIWTEWEELADLTPQVTPPPAKVDPHLALVNSVNFRKRFEAVRLAAKIDPWPKNCLRHSFASYFFACTHDSSSIGSGTTPTR
jgi:integrase